MTKYLGIMYKLKFIIPLKARLLIYQSFVQSHFNFCSPVLYGVQLLTVQKKAVRTAMPGYVQYSYELSAYTKPAFTKNNLLEMPYYIAHDKNYVFPINPKL